MIDRRVYKNKNGKELIHTDINIKYDEYKQYRGRCSVPKQHNIKQSFNNYIKK